MPETRLVHREEIDGIPQRLWPPNELHAFAVRRFDREPGRRVHMEDLAQVRGFYPDDKYRGSFETVAALIYRDRDLASVIEFVRRLAFNILVRNADAHLKNWSLLYRRPSVPELSPAYDLVCTSVYPDVDRDLGLRLCGKRRFEDVTLGSFDALQQSVRLPKGDVSFSDIARAVIDQLPDAWEAVEPTILNTSIGSAMRRTIAESSSALGASFR